MRDTEDKYFNFPIQLLQGFLVDDVEVLKNILCYCFYNHYLNRTKGNKEDRLNESAKYCGVNLEFVNEAIERGETLTNSLPIKSPITGIKCAMFFDFCNNEKTDFEKVTLLGFLAMKSILGVKPYCKLTNKYWFSRMDGCAKNYELSTNYNIIAYDLRIDNEKIKSIVTGFGLFSIDEEKKISILKV